MVPILAWLLSIGTGFPLLYWAAECCVGLRPVRRPGGPLRIPRYAVLIPAHDEAAGIGDTIADAQAHLDAEGRILVIADNCSDRTAQIAREAGVEVFERFDPARKGKAYALARGRSLLRRLPPEVVIVLDADCRPEPGALRLMAQRAVHERAAVQGRYLMTVPDDAAPIVRISSFAFLIKNSVRQRGLDRLGGTALLQGTGMAFPWRMFDTAPLETSSLVEDLKLGLDLVLAGQPVRFEDRARFFSAASTQSATVGQRTRWEHGAMATAGRYLPRLLWRGLGGHRPALWLAANLCVPPLMLLIALSTAVAAMLAVIMLGTGTVAPFAAIMLSGVAASAALGATWMAHGRALLPAALLPRLIQYGVWKLPVYGRFLARRQRDWVRTERA